MNTRVNWLPFAAVATVVMLCITQWFVWVYAPVETTLGPVQKLFYFHVALAWWALLSFFVVFAAGIFYLLRRQSSWDHLGGAAAEIGVLFSGLALVTGSVWGRASWGVWWTWDPRLTTTLIMWFVYCAYLILRSSGIGAERRPVVCAVVGIVAFLDVPLVFYSARMWRSIHPAVFGKSGGGMAPEMLTTMLVSIVAFGLLWLCMTTLRTRQLRHGERLDALARGDLN